jgi:benzoate/toluate 1,2-dioxygenase reductase subunit
VPRVTVRFANQDQVTFDADPGLTILESGEQAAVPLAYDCRSGICHTCAGRSETGEDVLLCSLRAERDMIIQLPYDRAQVLRPVFRRAKITALDRLCPGVWHLRCRLQFPLAFLPGQYVRLATPNGQEQRCFSMANAPGATAFEFYIRALPSGVISDYLGQRAKPGDILSLRGPSGAFYLRERRSPKLFIAGGTGLAPILSMLSALREKPDGCSAYLAYGVTQAEDAVALDLLRGMAGDLGLKAAYAAVKPGAGWHGIVGMATAALDALDIPEPLETVDVYICGPEPMVIAARAWLSSRGFTAERIFNETFVAS